MVYAHISGVPDNEVFGQSSLLAASFCNISNGIYHFFDIGSLYLQAVLEEGKLVGSDLHAGIFPPFLCCRS